MPFVWGNDFMILKYIIVTLCDLILVMKIIILFNVIFDLKSESTVLVKTCCTGTNQSN